MALGFQKASERFQMTVSNEIDAAAVKTHQLNYGHEIITDDIRKVSIDQYLQLREGVLVGTFPCQEYSKAAAIHKKGARITGSRLIITRLSKTYSFTSSVLLLWCNQKCTYGRIARRFEIIRLSWKHSASYHLMITTKWNWTRKTFGFHSGANVSLWSGLSEVLLQFHL